MKLLLLLLSIWIVAGPAFAQVYKWTDENGQVHYSDSKPTGEEVTEVEFSVSTYESVSYEALEVKAASVPTPETATRKKVVLFSASWCGVCKKAKRYFRRMGIPFTEYDIEKSGRGKRMYSELGATGVPVILVGNKRMNGFSEAGFERIYR